MQKKYIITLAVILTLLVATLFVGTGYGVWLSEKTPIENNIRNVDCFKIYYDNDGIIEYSKIKPVVNSDGESVSPYTVTVTNTCPVEKEAQIRLNTVETTTIDVNALTLKITGNIEKGVTLYKNLEGTKTEEEGIKTSRLLGKIKIAPNETVRTNIRIWFDEKKAPSVNDKNNYFKGHIEIIDSEKAIKPTFLETILANKDTIDKKKAPSFEGASYNEEGLYAINAPGGKYYYYRGVVNNNYVIFANKTWRIVGINPNNTIKLILNDSIGNIKYGKDHKYMDYVGFTYDYNKVQVNNDINNHLITWYKNNIANTAFDSQVVSYNFCNDASYKMSGKNASFSAENRLTDEVKPIMSCPAKSGDFGGVYNQKVGLITADEVVLAGGSYETNNYNYYLFNGTTFFTSTPSDFTSNNAYVFAVTNTGSLDKVKTDSVNGMRPVINISGELTYDGSGTQNNPYIINLK